MIGGDFESPEIIDNQLLTLKKKVENGIEAQTVNEIPVFIRNCKKEEFGSKLFRYTSTEKFMSAFLKKYEGKDFRSIETEEAVFEKTGLQFVVPELREDEYFLEKAANGNLPALITENDIKGVVHTHTTYSDGLNTLEEMANAAQKMGYEYIAISDHSKAAFYANGLKEDRLRQQWDCLLYTSPSPRDRQKSRMPSSA